MKHITIFAAAISSAVLLTPVASSSAIAQSEPQGIDKRRSASHLPDARSHS